MHLRFLWLQELVASNALSVKKIDRSKNVSDICTHAPSASELNSFLPRIGMVNHSEKATRILQPMKSGGPARLLVAMILAGKAAGAESSRGQSLATYGGELPATRSLFWSSMTTILLMMAALIFPRGFWKLRERRLQLGD